MDDEWTDPPALLEWILPKAEVVDEENVEVSEATNRALGEDDNHEMMGPAAGVPAVCMQSDVGMELGNGTDSGDGSRGKRAAVEAETERKERRRMKQKEAAARRRERKQAYFLELESSVVQLKEENARVLEEVAKLRQEREKQLMEDMIPVIDTRRPLKILRRAHSANW